MGVVVYNVPGFILAGVPAAPVETDRKTADRLIRTGAFAAKRSGAPDLAPVPYEPDARLDFYDSPVKHGDHYKHAPAPETAAADAPAPASADEPKE